MERQERNRLMAQKEREAENARNMEICRQQVKYRMTAQSWRTRPILDTWRKHLYLEKSARGKRKSGGKQFSRSEEGYVENIVCR